MAVLTVALGGATVAAPARAADAVTYEIVSDSIPVVDIEYMDSGGRSLITAIPLPWRMDVQLDNAQGPTGTGAQLRADWRRIRGPAKWVTVRILSGGRLLCQSTLDVGNATCYGNTPHSG
ncbi:hypothetical protein ACPCIR_24200 [Mycobacterium sp. NPDC051198]